MSTNPHGVWWTRKDAAAYAQVSEATIGREVRNARLRHARVGGRRALRFKQQWIDEWLGTTIPSESDRETPKDDSAPERS